MPTGDITTGPLQAEGVSVEVLGKTKTRLPGCILTAQDPKDAANIREHPLLAYVGFEKTTTCR